MARRHIAKMGIFKWQIEPNAWADFDNSEVIRFVLTVSELEKKSINLRTLKSLFYFPEDFSERMKEDCLLKCRVELLVLLIPLIVVGDI